MFCVLPQTFPSQVWTVSLWRTIINIMFCLTHRGSWDSSVDIVTGYGQDGRSSILGRRKRFFSSPQRLDRLWGQLSLLTNGYSGVQRPRRESDHSSLSSPSTRVVKLYVHSPNCLHGRDSVAFVLPLPQFIKIMYFVIHHIISVDKAKY
jgi:hypothetical protein